MTFEGSEIRLKDGFSVFITMNPGYAGRTELPDNLKALFRSVAMMVPDYALIAEIKLYSFGFIKARELARKMVATFKLSSEQLSSQYHYDYGMRAVTSVINAAGLLKRDDRLGTPEDVLLLRSLRDVNLPKFLKDDLPLFENIIKDLFPTTPKPVYDFTKLMPKIHDACAHFNLETVDGFITKVTELYNTMLVRHGLMLVGPAGGGKTSAYKVLQRAMSELAKECPDVCSKVNVEVLNPKSISMVQLYGEYREMNWNEGIIEIVFEKAIKAQFDPAKGGEKWWIMFDGPVDAVWIESMNTVLDDNKKLCLSSGKVLILSKLMTIMFEVEDLKEASPATVSRCGMVYMEPESLPVATLLRSFIGALREAVELDPLVEETFLVAAEALMVPTLKVVRTQCKEIVKTVDNNLVGSFCRLVGSFLRDWQERLSPIAPPNAKEKPSDEVRSSRKAEIECLVWNLTLYCTVWSVGCTCDEASRSLLAEHLASLIKDNPLAFKLITLRSDFYNHQLVPADCSFRPWLTVEQIAALDYSAKNHFSEITVPTIDSVRTTYLAETLLRNGHMVCTPGPSGTGKTTNAYSLLADRLNERFVSLSITFSAQTSANQVLETIFSQLSKRKRGIYGPPSGKTIVVFIDDLNMPKKEQYGAQPPIELLREFLDHSMVYVWKMNKEHLKFEDVLLLGAMGPASGGRAELSQRFSRHFNTIAYTELEQTVIRSIFSVILNTLLKRYSENVRAAIEDVIQMTCQVYGRIRDDLLPIPSKSHYLFTLRDFSRVMAGVCSSAPTVVKTPGDLLELWAHECMRVFHDRLINLDDRKYFSEQIESVIKTSFPGESDRFANISEQFSVGPERVIYFAGLDGPDAPYQRIESPEEFMSRLYEVQKDYNREAGNGRPKINLVLFLDACEHIAKVSRVLRQPQGHMLLLGVGGSGKQSLTRLSIYLTGQYQFSIEVVKGYTIAKWREDLKKLMYMALTEQTPVTFMISDTQLVSEQFVEDLSCLMNTGFLLNLPFNAEELKKLETIAKADCVQQSLVPNKINLQQTQIARFKRNSHIVFCMSPLGSQFANRLRMFPAIASCCTIDWFLEWPNEALKNVARDYLEEIEEQRPFGVPVPSLMSFFSAAHLQVQQLNTSFKLELGRTNYVTPTSYLELLRTFTTIFEMKIKENGEALRRLENGITKLKEANRDVERLQAQLVKEEPELRRSEEEVSTMLERVTADKALADSKREVVAREELEAKKAQDEASEIAARVKAEVDEADKELDKTLEKIGLLNQGHLNEIKSFDNPPLKVKHVFMATCVLLLDASQCALKPSWTDEEVENFFWKLAKSELLKNPQFLSVLKGINFQKVEMAKIKRIRELVVDHPKRSKTWLEAEMQKSNIANYCLFLLINAVVRFNELFEKTKPLRKQQEDVLAELEKKRLFLAEKNQELAVINEKLGQLEALLAEKNAEIKELRAKIEGSTQKLERAKKLTDLLADENKRWGEEIERLRDAGRLIEGNAALAAVMVNYAGPFTMQFRAQIERRLVTLLTELAVPFEQGISMRRLLAEEIKVLQWNLDGLPKDDCSLENAIIMENSARWSLIIDPQRQAFNFLKNSAKNGQQVQVVKNGSSGMLRELEQAVQFGKWLLIENCGAEIDPLLEPVVLKNITKAGGTLQIQLGDKALPYSDRFRLVLLTAVQNPVFAPEVCAKVSIVNFSITPSGLEEQMLAKIVNMENRQLEDQKSDIVTKNVEEKQRLLRLEDSILKTLSESKNDFLENSNLINQLASSKTQSTQIKAKVVESKALEASIDAVRERYRPLAKRVSLLFFCASSMLNVDAMYEFSLEWYKELFKTCVEGTQTEPGADRLAALTSAFTLFLFRNVCRSVFEKHKLLFSFMMAVAVMEETGEIRPAELGFLLSLSFMDSVELPANPTKSMPESIWKGIFRALYSLAKLERWRGVDALFIGHPEEFEAFYESPTPETAPLPTILADAGFPSDAFARLILVKILRPDKLLLSIQTFIVDRLGAAFTEFGAPNLGELYDDSSQTTP
jgi:dynein heavy chain